MADDGCRDRCTYRFIAVDLASGAARLDAHDGNDRVDWNRGSAGRCRAHYLIVALDRGVVRPVGPFTGAMFTTRKLYAPDEVQAQVFTISAGLRLTMAAAGATIGGALAGLPSPTLLIFIAVAPLLAGGVGALMLRKSRAKAQLQLQL